MSLPSFRIPSHDGRSGKPRILVLEVKSKNESPSETLGWVAVEREESYLRDEKSQVILEASIHLSYQRIDKSTQPDGDSYRFDACYRDSQLY